MAHTVSVYIRESGSRNYKPAKAIHYPIGTVFCIRYKQGGKRVWQNLPGVLTFGEAKNAALRKQIDLFTGVQSPPAPVPVAVKPVAPPTPVPVQTDTLGRAID